MKYRIFTLPIPAEESDETELNGFLGSHRVVNVTHDLVMKPDGACLVFVVEYIEGAGSQEAKSQKSNSQRIDYREKLSPEDFEIFRQLRDLRKTLAERDGVPVYTVFTNAQLAAVAESRVKTNDKGTGFLSRVPGR
jgi:superfamily II DNA helicase RecQ